jgi:Spy/CpxP family protein refolding chaperone
MKKTVTAAALIAALTFAGIQSASAHGSRYYSGKSYGPGYCGTYNSETRGYTEEDQAAFEKFRDDTTAIRKEIVVKRSELNALMRKDNADEKKVAKLTGDLYDLEAELETKAEAAGIDNRYAYRHGPGMMRGYGWGYGRHMMGW